MIFQILKVFIIGACCYEYEPRHEKICLMPYANNKGAYQPVHPRSQISTIVVRCVNSIISIVAI